MFVIKKSFIKYRYTDLFKDMNHFGFESGIFCVYPYNKVFDALKIGFNTTDRPWYKNTKS